MSFNVALRSEPFAVILLWIVFLVGLSLGVLMLGFEVNELINLITALNMAAAVYYCWRYTGNGQSFLFLYVVLFALFLGGRFITPFLGYDYQANYISFGSGSFVGLDTHRTYAYLVNICLITFFLAALLGRLDCDSVVVNYGDRNAGFKLFLKIGFLVCLPLYCYKNYVYLKYI